MTPPTIVTFKWKPQANYRSKFTAQSVLALHAMVARHYQKPHRFVCVTDDRAGLESIETLPLWPDHGQLPNPNSPKNPSCYRRLKLFAPDAGEIFGERVICLDLDTVAVGDLSPLFDRTEDFVIWGESDYPQSQWYNGSFWSLRTGTRTRVWTEFDPKRSPAMAKAAGKKGSDQGWFAYILGPQEATVGRLDGIYSFRKHIFPAGGRLPANARLVAFHGHQDPWGQLAQQFPWVREHWGVAA